MRSALLLAIVALLFLGVDALKSSTTARCGTQSKNTLTCKGSRRSCCSKSGYCGLSSAHCGKGCQAGFGDCTSSIATSIKSSSTSAKVSSASAKVSSTSTKSSISSAKVIVVSVTPTSASSKSSTASITSNLSTVTSSPIPVTTLLSSTLSSSAPAASSSSIPDVKVSTDGSCGGTQGFSCLGSSWGNCCSEYNWCGGNSIYCGAGCNAAFGTCNAVSASGQPSTTPSPASSSSSLNLSSFITSTRATSASPSSTQAASVDGQCGASNNGTTCLGSQFGNCCSRYGYCGSTSAFCGTGCQSDSGKCDTAPAPSNTCGVEGFANKAEYYASSFNLIPTAEASTCATLCLAEATCMSYIFNPGLQNCAYLTYSLEQGEFIATTGTNQFFWDRACAEATTA